MTDTSTAPVFKLSTGDIRLLAPGGSETLTVTICKALSKRLRRGQPIGLAAHLRAIGEHYATLADDDPRSPDEIVGYEATGMWT